MIRKSIYLLLTLFVLSHCSSKETEQPVAQDDHFNYGGEKEIATIPENNAEEVPLKNTTTYHTVVIRHMKFEPAVLKLHKGDTVCWVNKDITDHDVTGIIEKKWSSPKISMNKSWNMVVYQSADYFCSLHVVMKGKLLIE